MKLVEGMMVEIMKTVNVFKGGRELFTLRSSNSDGNHVARERKKSAPSRRRSLLASACRSRPICYVLISKSTTTIRIVSQGGPQMMMIKA